MTNWYGYPYIALTGGADGALDSLDGSLVKNGDFAIVVVPTSNLAYIYTLDEDSAAAESSPDVISPDANAGDKRWVLTRVADASTIDFTSTATGAVTRTIQSKARDVDSVFDFMTQAQIDDVTTRTASIDVTAAFNYALATGKPYFVPAGTYLVESALSANVSKSSLYGAGKDVSIINFTYQGTALTVGDATHYVLDIELRGLRCNHTGLLAGTIFLHQNCNRRVRFVDCDIYTMAFAKLGTTAVTVSNVVDNGSGLCRVTTGTHAFSTGSKVAIYGVTGATGAAGVFTVTVINSTTFDLQGSTFGGSYSAGGFASLHNYIIDLVDTYVECAAGHGVDIFSSAGSFYLQNSSIIGTSVTSSLPTTGYYGVYWRKATTAYLRFDYVKFIDASVSGFDRQIFVDNTRVVNLDMGMCRWDFWNTYGIYVLMDSVDQTGGGIEAWHANHMRWGQHTVLAGPMVTINADAAYVVDLRWTNVSGQSLTTPIVLTGGTQGFLGCSISGVNLNVQPTSGDNDGIQISGAIAGFYIGNVRVIFSSATYGRNGVYNTSTTADDLVIGHVTMSGGGGVAVYDEGIRAWSEPNNMLFGYKRQGFTFAIKNDGGTIKHSIQSIPASTADAATYAKDSINGATKTFTTTPTGTDSSTAFAAGGKIGSTLTQTFIFDTRAVESAKVYGTPSVVFNSSGTAVCAKLVTQSINVNGTTRIRPCLFFTSATDGTDFALNTSNIGSGKQIEVTMEPHWPVA